MFICRATEGIQTDRHSRRRTLLFYSRLDEIQTRSDPHISISAGHLARGFSGEGVYDKRTLPARGPSSRPLTGQSHERCSKCRAICTRVSQWHFKDVLHSTHAHDSPFSRGRLAGSIEEEGEGFETAVAQWCDGQSQIMAEQPAEAQDGAGPGTPTSADLLCAIASQRRCTER